MTIWEFVVIHGFAVELPSFEAYITWTHKVDNVEEGCFHLASLACRLRFPLPWFILEILGEYGIVPSQLAPNSWRIMSSFFLRCKVMAVIPISKLFRMFYILTRKGQF